MQYAWDVNLVIASSTNMRARGTWPAAILFDCDGVLVDSERPTQKLVQAWAIERLGLSGTDARAYSLRYRGIPTLKLAATPEAVASSVTNAELASLDALVDRTVRDEAVAISGVKGAVQSIPVIKAVVSNASFDWLQYVVKLADLHDAFDTRLFSAHDLTPSRPKPDPAIYLHATTALGLSPKTCIAIEDSPAGVLAANRAGIPTIGFIGDNQHPSIADNLLAAGAYSIAISMASLCYEISCRGS